MAYELDCWMDNGIEWRRGKGGWSCPWIVTMTFISSAAKEKNLQNTQWILLVWTWNSKRTDSRAEFIYLSIAISWWMDAIFYSFLHWNGTFPLICGWLWHDTCSYRRSLTQVDCRSVVFEELIIRTIFRKILRMVIEIFYLVTNRESSLVSKTVKWFMWLLFGVFSVLWIMWGLYYKRIWECESKRQNLQSIRF